MVKWWEVLLAVGLAVVACSAALVGIDLHQCVPQHIGGSWHLGDICR
jgi:hypothetical protein